MRQIRTSHCARAALAPLAAAAAIVATTASVAAQTPDVSGFVTRLGNDTLAVERVHREAGRIRAEVVLRVPTTSLRVYDVRLDDAGRPVTMRVESYDPARGRAAGPVEQSEVALDAGAGIPFIDMVHWPFELMVGRAATAPHDTVTLQLVAGRRSLPFLMTRHAPDRYSAAHPTRGTMVLRADRLGRLLELDASRTTRALRVERTAPPDIDALAREFAARDARGAGIGELSGRGEVVATIAGAEIVVDYGRPLERGRQIFGALVPWEQVWRTGANRATHFSTSRDLHVGEHVIPAGVYTLFTIPRPDRWTLIVNRRTDINGLAHDPAHDLLRIDMPVRTLDQPVETFTILVEPDENGGVLRLRWDTTEAYLPFRVAG